MKIMFAGASGVGKTTLAKEVPGMIKFDVTEYPPVLDFISGSVSEIGIDLLQIEAILI